MDRASTNEGKQIGIKPTTRCREYRGGNQHGYGFSLSRKRVHRLVMEMALGRNLHRSECVLHLCDNRACFLFEHLYLGTHAENMADMKAKGRGRSGRSNTKLTPEQVAEIAGRLTGKHGELSALGREYGVSHSAIAAIRDGVTHDGAGEMKGGIRGYGDENQCRYGHVGERAQTYTGTWYCRECNRERRRGSEG